MLASVAAHEKFNRQAERSKQFYNLKLSECIPDSNPSNAEFKSSQPSGAYAITKIFTSRYTQQIADGLIPQYVPNASVHGEKLRYATKSNFIALLTAKDDLGTLGAEFIQIIVGHVGFQLNGAKMRDLNFSPDYENHKRTVHYTNTFHLKLSENASHPSVIGFSTTSLSQFSVNINNAYYRFLVGFNEADDLGFIRLAQISNIRSQESVQEICTVYESLYIFNAQCRLTCNIIPSPFTNESKFDASGNRLKDGSSPGFEIPAALKGIFLDSKLTMPDLKTGLTLQYLSALFPETRYVDRVNRPETAHMNGIIMEGRLAKHKHRLLLEVSHLHFTFAALRAIAAVLLRVSFMPVYPKDRVYNEAQYASNKALNLWIAEHVDSRIPADANQSSLQVHFIRLEILARIVGALFKNKTTPGEANPNDAADNRIPEFTNMILDTVLFKKIFIPNPNEKHLSKRENFGHVLVPFLMDMFKQRVKLVNSLQYEAMGKEVFKKEIVNLKHASGKKVWNSHCKVWRTSFKIESRCRFFLDAKNLTESISWMDGYNLKKEDPNYKGERDPKSNISVSTYFKETYSCALKVPHQDIYVQKPKKLY